MEGDEVPFRLPSGRTGKAEVPELPASAELAAWAVTVLRHRINAKDVDGQRVLRMLTGWSTDMDARYWVDELRASLSSEIGHLSGEVRVQDIMIARLNEKIDKQARSAQRALGYVEDENHRGIDVTPTAAGHVAIILREIESGGDTGIWERLSKATNTFLAQRDQARDDIRNTIEFTCEAIQLIADGKPEAASNALKAMLVVLEAPGE